MLSPVGDEAQMLWGQSLGAQLPRGEQDTILSWFYCRHHRVSVQLISPQLIREED